MKILPIILLFLLTFSTFSQDDKNVNITEDWIANQLIQRKAFEQMGSRKLLHEKDQKILQELKKADIKSVEKGAVDLLKKIIYIHGDYNTVNIVTAFEILTNNFDDMANFLEVADNVVTQAFLNDSYVIAAILNGLRKSLPDYNEEVFVIFESIYPKLSPHAFNLQKIANRTVVTYWILFLREHIKYAEQTDDKDPYFRFIKQSCEDLQLHDVNTDSPFIRYPGAKELREEYVFYKRNF